MCFYRLKTCLIFTSPPSGFQRFFGGFCCLWRFFSNWELDLNSYPLITNLLLSCPCKPSSSPSVRNSPEKSSQPSIPSFRILSLYIRGQENNTKQKEKSQTPGEFFRGLMWFAQWRYPPGVSPWRFLMGRGAFRQEVLLGKMCPEHFRLPEVV